MSKAADGRSSIHRRADGNGWEGWFSFGTDPATARRRRKHVRGRTKGDVDDKIRAAYGRKTDQADEEARPRLASVNLVTGEVTDP